MSPIVFSPYGNLTEQHLNRLRQSIVVPADWRVPKGFPGTVDEHFERYQNAVIKVIDQYLWPQYTDTGWPAARFAQMEELTRLDFQVQQQASAHLDDGIAGSVIMTHRNLFQIEDGDEDFGVRYAEYDGGANFKLVAKIKALSCSPRAQDRKVGWAVVRLKQLFQRPRLYQTSLLLGKTKFEWQEAASSLTPAMPSGHALQGMMWVGAAVEQLLIEGTAIPDPLLQYLVDPGDRRVMAGVHYPSDNIASWLMIFLSIPFVFRNQGVREKFWLAIEKKSMVYGLMDAAGAAYRPALDALKAAASGALTVESALGS